MVRRIGLLSLALGLALLSCDLFEVEKWGFPHRLSTLAEFGTQTYRLAISPDGAHLYVATSGCKILVVRTADGRVIDTLPVAGSNGIVVGPDGRRLYAGHRRQHTSVVTAIDLASGNLDSLVLDGEVLCLAVSPDNQRLYVGLSPPLDSASVLALDPDRLEPVDTVLRSHHRPERIVCAGNDWLYVYSGWLREVRVSDDSITADCGRGPGYCILPDNSTLYIFEDELRFDWQNDEVFSLATVCDLPGLRTPRNLKVPGKGKTAVSLPDGRYVYAASDDEYRMIIVSTGADQAVYRTEKIPLCTDMVAAPGGSRVYYIYYGGYRLYALGC